MTNFNRIPAELKRYAQFVVWRNEYRDGNADMHVGDNIDALVMAALGDANVFVASVN